MGSQLIDAVVNLSASGHTGLCAHAEKLVATVGRPL